MLYWYICAYMQHIGAHTLDTEAHTCNCTLKHIFSLFLLSCMHIGTHTCMLCIGAYVLYSGAHVFYIGDSCTFAVYWSREANSFSYKLQWSISTFADLVRDYTSITHSDGRSWFVPGIKQDIIVPETLHMCRPDLSEPHCMYAKCIIVAIWQMSK
jgi:hypothetical protein